MTMRTDRSQIKRAQAQLERLADRAASSELPAEVDRLTLEAERLMRKIDALESREEKRRRT